MLWAGRQLHMQAVPVDPQLQLHELTGHAPDAAHPVPQGGVPAGQAPEQDGPMVELHGSVILVHGVG